LIPTQIFFDAEGNEVYRHEGFMDKESIKNKFAEMGVY
jgi:thioredoxin 1